MPAATPEYRESEHMRAMLAERITAIMERPRPVITAQQAQQEKQIVAECRYLMRLLASRPRSRGEMRQRLAAREVPPAIIHDVMARIERAGLIDDAAFAREWVRQRRERKGLADEALRRELAEREVKPADIDAALAEDDTGEEQRCRELVRARLRREARALHGLPEDGPGWSKVARRLEGLLRRRGFPGDLCTHVISTEMRAATGR